MKIPTLPKEFVNSFTKLTASTQDSTHAMINFAETLKSVKIRYHWLIYWLYSVGILKEKG